MTNIDSSGSSNSPRKLSLKGETPSELLITTDEEEIEEERVLASNASGGSLTLMEEYEMRNKGAGEKSFLFAFILAAVSLTFAYLNFLKL